MEEVLRFEALPATLGIEVESTGGEPSIARTSSMTSSRGRDFETVGVPSQVGVMLASIDPRACGSATRSSCLGVSCKLGMVGLDVQLEVLEQVVLPEEVEAGSASESYWWVVGSLGFGSM